jgi:hypothetical protein
VSCTNYVAAREGAREVDEGSIGRNAKWTGRMKRAKAKDVRGGLSDNS